MRVFLTLVLALLFSAPAALAMQPCRVIHGRARLYLGDGQLRIWHIGTHHEFEPADPASWDKLEKILLPHGWNPNVDGPPIMYELYADFTLCPTKPYRKGSVQPAIVKRIQHERRIRWPSQPAQDTSKPKPKASNPCNNPTPIKRKVAAPSTSTYSTPTTPAPASHL